MNALAPVIGGLAANASGKYSRKVFRMNAQGAEADGAAQRSQIRLAARQQIGRQVVGQADSGFQLGTGSGVDALRESAINRELDILSSHHQATAKAAGFTQQGDLAYAQGHAALVGGIVSGAATLANDAVSAFGGGGGLSAGNIASFAGGGG